MNHLTEAELVDLMDGVLPDGRRAHIQACAACQARATDIEWALGRAAWAEVPEPSPLFWNHLSARIHDAVASPEVAAGPERAWWGRAAWVGLGSLACVVALSISMRGPGAPSPPVVGNVPAATHAANPESLLADDLEADQAWALVRAVADQVAWDDTQDAGISPGPHAAESITLELSTPEQGALADLLQRELERAGT
jgi:predicted transcriptional regulator